MLGFWFVLALIPFQNDVFLVLLSGLRNDDSKLQRKSWPQFMQEGVFKEECATLHNKGILDLISLTTHRHAHTQFIHECPCIVVHHLYNTFTCFSMLMHWTHICIHCRIACSKTMSRKWYTCVILCLYICVLLYLDLNMISFDSLLSPGQFGYSFIRFRV